MKVIIQSDLSANDSDNLFKWGDCVFPKEGLRFAWAKPQCHIVASVNGSAVGHIGFGRFSVYGGEEKKVVIGVGGVVVRPEFQGQRIPEKMFKLLNTTEVLDSAHLPKTLFCPKRLVPYYARHGYIEYCYPLKFKQDWGLVESSEFSFMVNGKLGFSCAVSIPSYPW